MANYYAAHANGFGAHHDVEVFTSAHERNRFLSRHFSCDPISASEAEWIAQNSGTVWAHDGATPPRSWEGRQERWEPRWREPNEDGTMAFDLIPY